MNCVLRKRKAIALFTSTVRVYSPYGMWQFKRPMKIALIDSADAQYADQLIFVYQLLCVRHRIASIISHMWVYFAVNISTNRMKLATNSSFSSNKSTVFRIHIWLETFYFILFSVYSILF